MISETTRKYREDPFFHALVTSLVVQMENHNTTPSELREACMYAQYIHETRNPIAYVQFKQPASTDAAGKGGE